MIKAETSGAFLAAHLFTRKKDGQDAYIPGPAIFLIILLVLFRYGTDRYFIRNPLLIRPPQVTLLSRHAGFKTMLMNLCPGPMQARALVKNIYHPPIIHRVGHIHADDM